MKDFVSYEKLSKKKKKEVDRQNRSVFSGINLSGRTSENKKAYNRKRIKNEDRKQKDLRP